MIPVYAPWVGTEEAEAVKQAVLNGELSGLFGKSLPAFETEFARLVGVVMELPSQAERPPCTWRSLLVIFRPDSEILLSASTNIATALAIVHNNLIPVPIDSEPRSWNLNTDLIEGSINARTRGIMPVHLFGHPARMDRIHDIAQRYSLVVIEDCAEAHGALWQGKMAGSWGDIGCFSFLANKILTTGEGGMIVTNNDSLAEEMRLLRNMAFKQPRFVHDEAGYNFRMTGFQAALGLVQLSRFDEVLRKKRQIADWYREYLEGVPGITLFSSCQEGRHVYWVYGILLDAGLDRDAVMASLKQAGVETRNFFYPMNLQPCFQTIRQCSSVPCPVAEDLWNRGFYLPSGPNLSETQIKEVSSLLAEALQTVASR